MAAKLTRMTHKIAILLHLQFSLQAASSETFGYTLLYFTPILMSNTSRNITKIILKPS
jgi:hypothetical protein